MIDRLAKAYKASNRHRVILCTKEEYYIYQNELMLHTSIPDMDNLMFNGLPLVITDLVTEFKIL